MTKQAISHSFTHTLFTVLAAIQLGSSLLIADGSPDDVIILEEQTVTSRGDSLTVPSLEMAQAELDQVPGGSELIAAERYETGRASTMADTFFLSPGVVAQPRFGSDEARLSIRGSGLQRTFHGRGISLMQDGIPLNLADGGFDMQSIEPTATRYISVWRGANALAYGASTLGGAIDYTSRTGRDAENFARLEAGSFGYIRATVGGGFADGRWDGYLSATHYEQDGFRDHAAQENQRIFSNIGYRISDEWETRLYLTVVESDSELPGSLTKAELEDDPSQANDGFFGSVRYDNKRDYSLFRIANKTTYQASADTRFDLLSAFTHKDLDHPITPFVGVIDHLNKDWLAGAELTHGSQLFGKETTWRLGTRFHYGETHSATFVNNLGQRGAKTADADQTAINLEAFTEGRIQLNDQFSLIAGFSAAVNSRENKQNLGGGTSYDRDYEHFSPKLGFQWATEGMEIYGNISASYEPPSFSETNSSVAPNEAQEATTFEIGTRGQRGFIEWDLSLYHAQIENEFLALNDSLGTPLGTINAEDTTHSGVELGLRADLLGQDLADSSIQNRLSLSLAYTYGRFHFDNDPVYGDNQLAGLPPHLIRAQLLWENAQGWYAGPVLEWSPESSYIDHANTFSADEYAIFSFKFGRQLNKGLSWFVEVRNLTDEAYAATHGVIADAGGLDQSQFLPGDGRSVYTGIKWIW